MAATGLTLFACTGTNPRTSSPAPNTPAGPSRSSSNAPSGVFDEIKACDLLSPITSARGFQDPQEAQYESDNGCQTLKPRYGSVSTYLVDNAGIDQYDKGEGAQRPTTVSGRDAVEISGFGGSTSACLIGLSVTPHARVSVSLTLTTGTNEQACVDVRPIAERIAAQLPR
ncbi:DUF3558 family protein [Amycolatopsis sp. NPDC058340]|uniref:DUF3558 family protein n=1 Tax=Amycolatopsis sp. NPDC058340 TaxID=3346453 RepID=UPI0036509EBC